jgi:hypothetical protein
MIYQYFCNICLFTNGKTYGSYMMGRHVI